MTCPEGHAKPLKSLKFGNSRRRESRARTHGQMPLLRVMSGVACGMQEAFSLGNLNVTWSMWKVGKG